jgi:hypothetical protein
MYSDTETDYHIQGWPSVDDSGWFSGPAQLGYGDGDEATVISYGSNSSNKYPCYYFRHSFSVTNPNAYASLTLNVLRDDGCVVYLNGTEVGRSNMPSGIILYTTWATTAMEDTWDQFSVNSSLLVTGTNVVAVEIHQANATSSDLSFDLELLGEAPAPEVTLVSPEDESVVRTTTLSFTCSATDASGLASAALYIGNQPQALTFSGSAQTEDAQISADNPDTNFGSDATIKVDGLSPNAHGVIKFLNIFDNDGGPVPVGSSIVSATLEVNCTNTGNTMNLYRLTQEWVEGEATWNQRAAGVSWSNPGADGSGSNAGIPLNGDCSSTGWRTINITQFVQEWSSGAPNFGIVLIDSGTDGVVFDSSESANPPVLRVSYQTQWQEYGTQQISGQSATVEFQNIELSDETSYVWNCLVTNTSGQASWAPADFRLTVDTHSPNEPILVVPTDDATGVSTSASLTVTVSDPDNDSLNVTFCGRGGSGEEFTIVALPDTQKYLLAENIAKDIFSTQTRWIKNNATALNIVFVTQEGDIVDVYNDTTQWGYANTSMSYLDGFVPYGIPPGNHDMVVETRATPFYDTYFNPARYAGQSWYGGNYGSTNANSYQLFSAGGQDYIVVHLEFWPRPEVITWADSMLKAHPDRKAIITTHGFLGADGSHYVHTVLSTEYIWEDLVVPNDNVHFVLSGHVAGECARTDIVNGREVHQLLADYQGELNGGNGWLRIMRFVPAEDKVYVQTYSPYLNQYQTDANSQFTLNFPMGGFSEIGSTSVSSGSNASVVWPGLSENTLHEWYVTVTDPTSRTQTGPVWQFTTESNDTTPPNISGVDAVDITDGSARIIWTTDELADSVVDYGPEATYGSQASDLTLVKSHSITLTGLAADTLHHYRVSSKDSAENVAYSADYTFTTPPLNHPPIASDQSVNTDEDKPVSITLIATDEDGDSLTYSIVANPANGSLTGTPPNVTYTPNTNYNGADTFTFKANDGKTDSNIATVSITINSVNDPPAAPTGLSATAGVGKVTLDWADNAEPEGDLQGYNVYRSTAHGGPYTKINGALLPSSNYPDSAVVNGTTYYYVVTAVDTVGSESSDSNEASATPYAQQSVHVQDITMTLQKVAKTSYKASARVLIVDQNSAPRSGAKVTGNWYFKGSLIKTGASGTTDSTGKTTITSPQKTAGSGNTFTFKVTNVSLTAYPYAPEHNVETQDSITVP